MNRPRAASAVFTIWAFWHGAFGALASFAPDAGGRLVGWVPASGWTPELLAMSHQYGLAMLVLAGVYLMAARDPARYRDVFWIAVGEQVLGILFTTWTVFVLAQASASALVFQVAVNLAAIVLLLVMRMRVADRPA